MAATVDHFALKPFDVGELKLVLARLLHSPHPYVLLKADTAPTLLRVIPKLSQISD